MNWLAGRNFDIALFHAPVWLCWVLVLAMPETWRQAAVPIWVWVSVVLVVDVGHVWSSIYRTYLDPTSRKYHRVLLRVIPIACFIPCLILALHSDELFWRVLAYVAVYHFIKQQVGFAALYRYRHFQGAPDLDGRVKRRIAHLDKWTVYAGTVGPVIFWHFNPDRQFNWFIPNDFVFLDAIPRAVAGLPAGDFLLEATKIAFYGIWFGLPLLWLYAHLRLSGEHGVSFPLGKALWVGGTWINWYMGIVYFDSDLVFTLTNVIAHGLPYYGLIGLYSMRKAERGGYGGIPAVPTAWVRRAMYVAVFLVPIWILALGEEYLWNYLVYRDYGDFFEALWTYPTEVVTHPVVRAVIIALLSMPQVVHYLLDGYIWKFNSKNPDLKEYLLPG